MSNSASRPRKRARGPFPAETFDDGRPCGPIESPINWSGEHQDQSPGKQTLAQRRNHTYILATALVMLVLTLSCGAGVPADEASGKQYQIPTPDRSQVLVTDEELPTGLTDADAISAYRNGYADMQAIAWPEAIASYHEAIRIQPDVSGLYEARGTAYMYAGQHDQALADYTRAIEINPDDAGHWRQRAHAYTIAPMSQPERGVEDATRAIELEPDHPMGYGHRAMAYTQLPTPEWDKALADMNRHIELFEGRDPEAYRLRAWIHENLGNHEAAERDRRLAR